MIITHQLICSKLSTWKKKEENKLPTEITIIFSVLLATESKKKKGKSAGNWALLSSMVQKK